MAKTTIRLNDENTKALDSIRAKNVANPSRDRMANVLIEVGIRVVKKRNRLP